MRWFGFALYKPKIYMLRFVGTIWSCFKGQNPSAYWICSAGNSKFSKSLVDCLAQKMMKANWYAILVVINEAVLPSVWLLLASSF